MIERLSNEDEETIEDALQSRSKYLKECLERLKQGVIDREERLALHNIVSDEFSRIGLDERDEPNELGRRLDEVMAKLDFED